MEIEVKAPVEQNGSQESDPITQKSERDNHEANDDSAKWYLSEEVAGKGEVPDWFNAKKYKTVAEQAKAQRSLEQKLGSFSAPPDKYEVTYPADFPEELKFPEGDPLFAKYQADAKKMKMSNEAFNQLYINSVYNDYQLQQKVKSSELAKLGPNAIERLNRIASWAENNLTSEQTKELKLATQSSAIVELIEQFIDRTREFSLPQNLAETRQGITEKALNSRVADPRYSKDESFRRETSKLFQEFYSKNEENF